MSLFDTRIDLAAAYRLAERFGLNEGISNHFTARVPGERDQFLVIPHGLYWSEVRASDLLVVGEDGRILEGDGEVEPSALFIHSRFKCLRSRPAKSSASFRTRSPKVT